MAMGSTVSREGVTKGNLANLVLQVCLGSVLGLYYLRGNLHSEIYVMTAMIQGLAGC